MKVFECACVCVRVRAHKFKTLDGCGVKVAGACSGMLLHACLVSFLQQRR